jgi:nitrogen fixation NifU-like protein
MSGVVGMSRLENLYQEMILDHNKHPRHFCALSEYTHDAFGKNPLCGDEYHLELFVTDGVVSEVGFQGSGCAISKASGSVMSSEIIGKPVEDVLKMKDVFLDGLMGSGSLSGKLKVFEGVKKFPARVKCATLIWRALEAALSGSKEVSTES